MLSGEALKSKKMPLGPTKSQHTSESNIRDIMQALTLSIEIPSEFSDHYFAAQLRYHITRMSEQLGIFTQNNECSEIIDQLQLTLTGNNIKSVVLIPLRDDEGHYFSEISLQASSGIMAVHSRNRNKQEALGVDYVTVMTATNALTGLFAQFYQQLTQTVNSNAPSKNTCSPIGVALLGASQYIADATVTEPFPLPEGAADITRQPPFCSLDGTYFELESLNAAPWKQFWESLNVDNTIAGKGWQAFQLRYAKAVSPLPKIMVDVLKQYSFAEIKKQCNLSGMHITPVCSLNEYAKTPQCKQLWHNGPWQFAHWQSIKTEKVFTHHFNKKNDSNTLPLTGIKLVESCRRIQGPLASHVLSLLGAEVIRIEPPGGDPLRGMPPVVEGCSVRFNAINGDKKVVEINIKENVGKQEVFEQIDDADVFIHNWAPDKASQLGLDYTALSAINPNLIYSYASGWADNSADKHADYLGLPGTDFMVQAVSGIASTIAMKQQSKQVNGGSLYTVLDTLGGAIAAQGIVVALLARQLHGSRCYLETSLLGAANILSDQWLSTIYRDHYKPSDHGCPTILKTKTELIAVSLPLLDTHIPLAKLLNIDISPEFAPRATTERLTLIARQFQLHCAEYWLLELSALKISAAVVNTDLADLSTKTTLRPWIEKTHFEKIKSPWRFL